jgi:integrase
MGFYCLPSAYPISGMAEGKTMKFTKMSVDALSVNEQDQFSWDSEVRRFGVRVKTNGLKTFLIQYRNRQGRSRRYSIGKFGTWTVEEARAEAKRLLRLVDQGQDPANVVEEERDAITIKQLCVLYLEAAEQGLIKGRFDKPKKASTLLMDKSRVERHINPLIGDRLVKDLSRSDVSRLFNDIFRGKTKKVEKTKPRGKAIVTGGLVPARRSVGLLGSMMAYAMKNGYRPDGINPCHKLDLVGDNKRVVMPSRERWQALGESLKTAEARGERWQALAIARLLSLTGARRDEISELSWDEVDLIGRCFRFDEARVKSGVLRPIGEPALRILRSLKAEAENKKTDSKYVFPAVRGDGPYQGFPKIWRQMVSDYTPHGLRHMFASWAENECGLHESTIGGIIGHTKRGTITRNYVHKPDAMLIAAADKVSRSISEAITGDCFSAEIVPLERATGRSPVRGVA